MFARPRLAALLQIPHAVFPQNAGSSCVPRCHFSDRRSTVPAGFSGHRFAHQAHSGRINGTRGGRLQQAAARSGDRIPEWRDLSLSGCAVAGLSNPYKCALENAVLPQAHSAQISISPREGASGVKQQVSKRLRREIFVLTPEEKRTICFVLVAFLLGVATKHYRADHSASPLKIAVDETSITAAHPAQKRAESRQPKQAK